MNLAPGWNETRYSARVRRIDPEKPVCRKHLVLESPESHTSSTRNQRSAAACEQEGLATKA